MNGINITVGGPQRGARNPLMAGAGNPLTAGIGGPQAGGIGGAQDPKTALAVNMIKMATAILTQGAGQNPLGAGAGQSPCNCGCAGGHGGIGAPGAMMNRNAAFGMA